MSDFEKKAEAEHDADANAALDAALIAVLKPFDSDNENGAEVFQRDLIRAWIEIKKISDKNYLVAGDHILATAVAARMVDCDVHGTHPYSNSGVAILSAIKVFELLARLSDVATAMDVLTPGEGLLCAELADANHALELYDKKFPNNQGGRP